MTMNRLDLHRQEIETLRLCKHPNIVGLNEVCEDSENLYISMEFLRGGDLASFLEKQAEKLPEEKVQRVVFALLKGLKYMHSLGIVHRDLKPKNILLTDDTLANEVKIADFGLAVLLEPKKKCKNFAGTPNYIAPETLLEFPSDQAADMWSLGVIVYLLFSGHLPFPEAESIALQKQYCYKLI